MTFRATCRTGYRTSKYGPVTPCGSFTDTGDAALFDTNCADPVASFLWHMREHHGKRLMSPSWALAPIRRGWHPPKPKPFDVEPFERGDWITWSDKGTTRTGQVWACHTKDTRWVADGTTFYDVHRAQLITTARSAA